MEYRSPQHVERCCRGGVDQQRGDCVYVHHSNPTTSARSPLGGAVIGPSVCRIALFEAPIGVRDDLVRAHPGEPERRYGHTHSRRGQFESQAFCQHSRADAVGSPLQQESADYSHSREHRGQQHRSALDEAVAAAPHEHRGGKAAGPRPNTRGSPGEGQVQCKRHRAYNAAVLDKLDQLDAKPDDQRPRHAAPFRAGQAVEGVKRGLAGTDCVLAELQLHDHLDGAADEDDPQRDEAGRGSKSGSHDEFARADDVGSED